MCLHPMPLPPMPEETARVAKASFPKGNLYLTIGEQIGPLFADLDFQELYAADGPPAVSPALLALVMIFQFMEDLPDREAADAVRARIDWKYALHLPLEYAGFDQSVLSDFRQRLVEHEAGQQMFALLLKRLGELGLVRQGGKQRTDSTYVLAAVRVLNRLELIAETMRLALEALATYRPQWVRSIALPAWYERYNRVLNSFHLPRAREKREALEQAIGQDGFYLLAAVARADAPDGAAHLPEVAVLRQVWQQQLEQREGKVQWKAPKSVPPAAELVATPHDPEARYTVRRGKTWTGYRVHLTESCEEDLPHLITQVETTLATTADVDALPDIHANLAQVDVLPGDHLLDAGYVAGHTIVESREQYGVNLVGPVRADTSWQARSADGLTIDKFQIAWAQQLAICPEGQRSTGWSPGKNAYDQPIVHIHFPKAACTACPSRPRCTQGAQSGRTLKVSLHQEAILAARQRQETQAFRTEYALRAGMEGTISADVRKHGARRSRYIGQDKTHLQQVLSAMAINLKRAALWLMGERPETTRSPGLYCLSPAYAS